MTTLNAERLFVDLWKAGVTLTIAGNRLHYRKDSSRPFSPPDLIQTLRDHKDDLIHFLSHWIEIPGYGQAKLWGFLADGRAGVVLRKQPDRVTWISKEAIDSAHVHTEIRKRLQEIE